MHAKRNSSDSGKILAPKLFGGHNCHISTILLLKPQEPYSPTIVLNRPSLFSSLRYESAFGIVETMGGLGDVEGYGINQRPGV